MTYYTWMAIRCREQASKTRQEARLPSFQTCHPPELLDIVQKSSSNEAHASHNEGSCYLLYKKLIWKEVRGFPRGYQVVSFYTMVPLSMYWASGPCVSAPGMKCPFILMRPLVLLRQG